MKYATSAIVLASLGAQILAQAPATPPVGKTSDPKGGKNPVPLGPKPSGCSAFEILVARGTGEPGPFGLIAGDPLVRNVVAQIPDSRGYAVQYPATYNAESVYAGADDVVARIASQTKECPNQKFALVGYSQGARVMRAAAKRIPTTDFPKILALVMFGDRGMRDMTITQFPAELSSKLWQNCAPRDPGCSGVGTDSAPHLTYNKQGTTYQADSAKFIVAAFKGTPLPAKPTIPQSELS